MTDWALPGLTALFLWWSSTGLILYLDGLAPRTFRWSFGVATGLAGVSGVGTLVSRGDASLTGAYVAFACGLGLWGWLQMAFYLGYLAGPRTSPIPADRRGWLRFRNAVEATLYHELAIAATALGLFLLTRGQPNSLALWTFLLLWGMHVSAKLNLFLGVRNLNEQFFPEHLAYLVSFLRKGPMNAFLPASLAASLALGAFLVERAVTGETPFQVAAAAFLATLTILAALEHALMVLPLPAERLWDWGMRSRQRGSPGPIG